MTGARMTWPDTFFLNIDQAGHRCQGMETTGSCMCVWCLCMHVHMCMCAVTCDLEESFLSFRHGGLRN